MMCIQVFMCSRSRTRYNKSNEICSQWQNSSNFIKLLFRKPSMHVLGWQNYNGGSKISILTPYFLLTCKWSLLVSDTALRYLPLMTENKVNKYLLNQIQWWPTQLMKPSQKHTRLTSALRLFRIMFIHWKQAKTLKRK